MTATTTGSGPPTASDAAIDTASTTMGGATVSIGDTGANADGAGGSASVDATTKPLSGITVSIAGTVVPKEKVIVFLHVGHSNMAGRATGPAELHSFEYDTDPHLWAYGAGGAWRPAAEPLSPDSATLGKAGPGMSILRTALAMAPELYMVSIGHGHSGDTGGYCRNFRKGGLFYDIVMGPALELKGKVTFGGVFGMFGIAENVDLSHAGQFGVCLAGVIGDMRADLQEPSLPFLIGDWEATMGEFAPTSSIGMTIIPQLHMVANTTPSSKLIPSNGLALEDDHHYNFAGHKAWAERGFALMKEAGMTPWATR